MDDKKIIFSMVGVSKNFGPQKRVLNNIYLSFFYGAKIGIIGLNGAGKSTLMKIIAGVEKEYEGEVVFSPGYTVGYLEQDPKLDPNKTVRECVQEGVQPIIDMLREYDEINNAFADPEADYDKLLARQAEMQDKLDASDAWNIDNRLDQAMQALRCPANDQPVTILSGGERRRVALCRLLLQQPDILLLDEPTNHLDAESIDWLEKYLQEYKGTVICITHDRYFLDHVCQDILELDNSRLYHYRGNYDYYLRKKEERQYNERVEVEKAKSLYRTELDWMRRMPQARGTKAQARIDAFYELEEKAHTRFDESRPQLTVKTERIGGKILEMYNVTKSYDGVKMLDDFSYVFKKGEKIGIVGPNGVGKSTFLNILTEQLRPDSGRVVVGQTIQFGFYTQGGMTAREDMRVIELVKEVAERIELDNGKEMSAHQFLSYFGFDDMTQYNYFGNLSGGERRRLYLLKVLMANPNFLILDEPTNDLDIYTLEILEQFLKDYKGCLVIVSHDRSFMDHIVDHIFVFEGEGKIRDYHSNYTEYLANRNKQQRQETLQRREEKPKYERVKNDRPRATYKQQKEYEALTTELEALNKEKAELENLLSSGSETDVGKLTSASQRIGTIMSELDEKEMRWLELDEIVNG